MSVLQRQSLNFMKNTKLYNKRSIDFNYHYFLAILVFFYIIFSVTQGLLYSQIHTDEFWYVYEARAIAEYSDVFNHRLPLQSYVYGIYGRLFGTDILTLRMLSVCLFIFSIFIFLYFLIVVKKNNPVSTLLAALIFCHPFLIDMAATVTSYSLSIFLLVVFIILFEQSKFYQAIVPFLSLYLTRYTVDFSIFVFPAAAILSKINKKIYFNLSVFMILIVAILFIDQQTFKNTFLFNLAVKDFQIERGILSNDVFKSFTYLRKLEFLAFFMLLPVVALLFLNIKIKDLFSSNNLVYLIFIFGGFSYYWLTFNDYPITKLIFFPLIAILVAKLAVDNFLTKLTIILVGVSFFYMPNLILKNENIVKSTNVCEFISCESTDVLALNPIVASEFKSHIPGVPMELYSFAFDQKKHFDGLISSDQFVKLIKEAFPKVVIIDSRLTARKNMSRVFSDRQYNNILQSLGNNYELKKSYFDPNFGEDFFIYVKVQKSL
jgi:hypothetical protein